MDMHGIKLLTAQSKAINKIKDLYMHEMSQPRKRKSKSNSNEKIMQQKNNKEDFKTFLDSTRKYPSLISFFLINGIKKKNRKTRNCTRMDFLICLLVLWTD